MLMTPLTYPKCHRVKARDCARRSCFGRRRGGGLCDSRKSSYGPLKRTRGHLLFCLLLGFLGGDEGIGGDRGAGQKGLEEREGRGGERQNWWLIWGGGRGNGGGSSVGPWRKWLFVVP